MYEWYASLSLFERATFLLLIAAYIVVVRACFKALQGSPAVWYRSIQATPIFQVLMWIAVAPLIIPVLYLMYIRRTKLKRAPLIGNIRSGIFHLKTCEYQQKIGSGVFRYPFYSSHEAEACGFRACRVCSPC